MLHFCAPGTLVLDTVNTGLRWCITDPIDDQIGVEEE